MTMMIASAVASSTCRPLVMTAAEGISCTPQLCASSRCRGSSRSSSDGNTLPCFSGRSSAGLSAFSAFSAFTTAKHRSRSNVICGSSSATSRIVCNSNSSRRSEGSTLLRWQQGLRPGGDCGTEQWRGRGLESGIACYPSASPDAVAANRTSRRRGLSVVAYGGKDNVSTNGGDSAGAGRGSSPQQRQQQQQQLQQFNGVFLLLLLNVAVFVADHILQLPVMRWLYLHHGSARWYQFVTATFCHSNWSHLSGNLFFLYIFGRLVEEEEGSMGLWATYLITGAGANIVSWLLLPRNVVSVGASGAVFGLFAVSVLTRIQFNWRKLLEVVILGQFVVERVVMEAQSTALMAGGRQAAALSGVNHVAHLAGALVGVLLIWLVSRLPDHPHES